MPTRDGHREDPAAVARLDPLSTSVDEPAGGRPEHWDYLERTPGGCTHHFVRPGWPTPARTQNPT